MELVTINNDVNNILRQNAQEVEFPLSQDIRIFINNLIEFMTTLDSPFKNPAGLAAPQLGAPWRIIAVQVPVEAKEVRKDVVDLMPLTILINPSYKPNSEKKCLDWEGCYSVPEKMGEVERYYSIEYTATLQDGSKVIANAEGFLARVLQHEIDHLDGKLYIDLLDKNSRFGSLDEMLPIRQKEFNEDCGLRIE